MNKERIREIELSEILRLKREIEKKDREINTDFEKEIEFWTENELEIDVDFDTDTPEGSKLYDALESAVELKIAYNNAMDNVRDCIEEYEENQIKTLEKLLEKIQNFGIEMACPKLIEELDRG